MCSCEMREAVAQVEQSISRCLWQLDNFCFSEKILWKIIVFGLCRLYDFGSLEMYKNNCVGFEVIFDS